jgi:TatD DNase family protein
MIDTHCHLDIDSYDSLDDVIKNMNGNKMIAAGTDLESSEHVLALVNKYPNVYGVIGFHPEEVDKYQDSFLSFLEENLQNPKIVGIGEIGLDYHYTKENSERQKELFIEQIQMAKKYHKAIVVHSRDAYLDTLEILKKEASSLKIILHCFGYSYEGAKEFLKLNLMLGIGGVVTFKNGKKLKEVVENVDIDRLLLETDSPYLSPEPFRGKKNEPYNIVYVAEEIAKIKNISKEEVLKITYDNAIRQFDLKD